MQYWFFICTRSRYLIFLILNWIKFMAQNRYLWTFNRSRVYFIRSRSRVLDTLIKCSPICRSDSYLSRLWSNRIYLRFIISWSWILNLLHSGSHSCSYFVWCGSLHRQGFIGSRSWNINLMRWNFFSGNHCESFLLNSFKQTLMIILTS